MKSKNRDYSIDFLKGIAIIMVIFIHISAFFLDIHFRSTTFYTLIIVDLVSQAAVPLFFFISGYLASKSSDIENNVATFYKKKILRVIPLYLLVCTFYYFYFKNPGSYSIESYIRALFFGSPAYYHLWFIPNLLFIYFLAPLFFILKKQLNPRSLYRYSLILIPLFSSLAPLFISRSYTIFLPTGVLFFFLGFVYKDTYTNKRLDIILGSTYIFILTAITLIWSNYGLSDAIFSGRPVTIKTLEFLLASTLSLIMVLMLFKYRHYIYRRLQTLSIVNKTGQLSFEVYLVHAFYISLISKYLIQNSVPPSQYYFYIILCVSVFSFSFLTAKLINMTENLLRKNIGKFKT